MLKKTAKNSKSGKMPMSRNYRRWNESLFQFATANLLGMTEDRDERNVMTSCTEVATQIVPNPNKKRHKNDGKDFNGNALKHLNNLHII